MLEAESHCSQLTVFKLLGNELINFLLYCIANSLNGCKCKFYVMS